MRIATPPERSHLPLSQQPPLKVEVLSSPPPLFENLVGGSTLPPPTKRGGAHYVEHNLYQKLLH